MKPLRLRLPKTLRLRRFVRDESGATLVEFALVVLLFLTLMFAIIDFGRLAHTLAAAQKATQIAARIAAVRPPACPGVPEMNDRGASGTGVSYGTLCRAGVGVCFEPAEAIDCTGAVGTATAIEIVDQIGPLLPGGAGAENLHFTYQFDRNLGFLGGPYVPMVTVELRCVQFVFATRLDVIINGLSSPPTAGVQAECGERLTDPAPGITLPQMSISVPGEDLALGTAG